MRTERGVVIELPDGAIEFRLFLPDAEGVEILGDFTGWRERAVRMEREEDGWWRAAVRVARGDYLFSYLVNGERWLPDYAAHGIRANRFGGWVSQLSVGDARVLLAA